MHELAALDADPWTRRGVAIAGGELAENLKKHVFANAKPLDPESTLEVKEAEKVTAVEKAAELFSVATESGEKFETKTII